MQHITLYINWECISNQLRLVPYILTSIATCTKYQVLHEFLGRTVPIVDITYYYTQLHAVWKKPTSTALGQCFCSIMYYICVFFIVFPHVIPIIGMSNMSGNSWKLDPTKQCFSLPGRLPYNEVVIFTPQLAGEACQCGCPKIILDHVCVYVWA